MAVLARQSLTDLQFQAFSIGNYVLKGHFDSLRFIDFQLLINYYFATDWYIIPFVFAQITKNCVFTLLTAEKCEFFHFSALVCAKIVFFVVFYS